MPLFAVHPSLAASIPPSGSLLPPPWSVRSVALGIGLHSWSGGSGYGVEKVIFRLRNRYCKKNLFVPDMLEMRTRMFQTVTCQAKIPPPCTGTNPLLRTVHRDRSRKKEGPSPFVRPFTHAPTGGRGKALLSLFSLCSAVRQKSSSCI